MVTTSHIQTATTFAYQNRGTFTTILNRFEELCQSVRRRSNSRPEGTVAATSRSFPILRKEYYKIGDGSPEDRFLVDRPVMADGVSGYMTEAEATAFDLFLQQSKGGNPLQIEADLETGRLISAQLEQLGEQGVLGLKNLMLMLIQSGNDREELLQGLQGRDQDDVRNGIRFFTRLVFAADEGIEDYLTPSGKALFDQLNPRQIHHQIKYAA